MLLLEGVIIGPSGSGKTTLLRINNLLEVSRHHPREGYRD
ncbi:putative amino-acid ABC transporter ATP-binding protein YecC [Yersinia frederiksenii]|nr:putative amino-acid ABC transporter ATP-binding protein YecC [Yersinia frederiksenii]